MAANKIGLGYLLAYGRYMNKFQVKLDRLDAFIRLLMKIAEKLRIKKLLVRFMKK